MILNLNSKSMTLRGSLTVAVCTMLFCCLASLTSQAQSKEEKEVAEAVETLRKAMVDSDKAGLEKITAPELSYGHSNGKIENKAEFIESMITGKSDFVTINLADQTIQILGQVALVRHKLTGDTNNEGKPGTVNLGVLLVWQKQQGKWKLIGRQAYKL